jgi:hypothetical protein
MKTCTQCGLDVADHDLVCGHCGLDVNVVAMSLFPEQESALPEEPPVLPDETQIFPEEMAVQATDFSSPMSTPDDDTVGHGEPAPASSVIADALPASEPRPSQWRIAVVAAAALVIGGTGVILSLPARQPVQAVTGISKATTIPQIRKAAPSARPTDSSPTPKWSRTRESRWATDGSKMIGFELEAEREVGVWMKRVRPVLAVRCLSHATEVYVVTDSAASIEPIPDRHTVHVSFDDGAAADEHWLDSAAHRELFAPDGTELARRIARSRTMRFGFTPFNAPAVNVDFDVRGFEGPLESVAKTCRSSAPARAQKTVAAHRR